jgi:hypothetical protein
MSSVDRSALKATLTAEISPPSSPTSGADSTAESWLGSHRWTWATIWFRHRRRLDLETPGIMLRARLNPKVVVGGSRKWVVCVARLLPSVGSLARYDASWPLLAECLASPELKAAMDAWRRRAERRG